jgi:hypothetical protein
MCFLATVVIPSGAQNVPHCDAALYASQESAKGILIIY